MDDLTPQEDDFGIVYDYLPTEGHPQDVEEDKCPYCALHRIHSSLAERDRMLRLVFHSPELCNTGMSDDEWLADLHARTEDGS